MGAKSRSKGRKAAAQAARRGRYAPEGGGTLRKGRKKLDDLAKTSSLRRSRLVASAFALALLLGFAIAVTLLIHP